MQYPRFCFAFAILLCVITTMNGCFITGQKDAQSQIHVIQLEIPPDHGGDDEPEVIELHIPDSRKKRDVSDDNELKICMTDKDCPEGQKCNTKLSTCHDPAIPEKSPEKPADLEAHTPHHSFISVNIKRKYSN